ncbi:endonuclease domain-containing protein [Paraglaciecola polaris]|uniref:Restriction endonuclease type II-like domain-containing protein n=1 Tax=Paraglaciecola polaris LMG 21857 TaxID=1129793 RepID=K6ZXJ4_9ALTE|nr:DUF559 domain-containing protein [Paraglaciecola polaris]GAC34942.1 hypothetical protein GPLA_4063 [Paraglaciecola polaris LMG 21857]
MDNAAQASVREYILDDEQFPALLDHFLRNQAEESMNDEEDPIIRGVYPMAINTITKINSDMIDSFQESPIEKIFLRSLILGIVKNDPLFMVIHQLGNDAEYDLENYRKNYNSFCELLEFWESNKSSDMTIDAYLDMELDKGKMSIEERKYIGILTFRYHLLDMHESIHLTLQPKFSSIMIDGKSIRPDLYFWHPSRKDFGLIVECDGFEYHSSKEMFSKDRKRDRALHSKGYKVLRFSGQEIYNTPVSVAEEILDTLQELLDV